MAADSTVRLLVDARNAITGLRRTNQETKKLEGAVRDLNGKLGKAKGRFVDVGRSAKTASKGVNTLARTVKGLLGALAAIETAKFVFFKTAELETQTKSLQVLTGSLETAKGIIGELQAFGRVTPFTSSELIETAKRLKAFGFETNQVVDVTKRLADVAGATGADLGGIATAFGQIQAKGRLQGEELLQLQERGVGLQSKLKEMYGLTGEEFSKALQQGRISAEAVNFALIELTKQGGQYANGAIAQSDTLAGKFSTLQDGIGRLAQSIGETIAPAIKGITDLAITGINSIQRLFDKSLEARNFGFSQEVLNAVDAQARADTEQLARLRKLSAIQKIILQQERARDLLRQKAYNLGIISAPEAGPISMQSNIPMPALTQGTSAGGSAAKQKAATISPEERQIEQMQRMVIQMQNRLSLAQALNEEERRTAELNIALADIKRQFPDLSDEELQTITGLTIQYQDQLRINDERLKQKDLEKQKSKELEEQQAQAAARLAQIYRTIGDSIKSGVVDMLSAAIDETKSLAEAASSVLRSIANTLLNLGINTAFGALGAANQGNILGDLFGTGQPAGRASGGTVTGGTSYVVGEKGPELFTPGRSGSIAPNSAMTSTGSIVVNVDAKGSTAQGDSTQAKALGEALGSAVRQELLKQKRPGGLLA